MLGNNRPTKASGCDECAVSALIDEKSNSSTTGSGETQFDDAYIDAWLKTEIQELWSRTQSVISAIYKIYTDD